MKIDLNNLLHPRIIDKSISLYKDGNHIGSGLAMQHIFR